jgi:hypothetical protein
MNNERVFGDVLRAIPSFSNAGRQFIEQAVAAGEFTLRTIGGREFVSWNDLNPWLPCGSDPQEWVEECSQADVVEV